MAKHEAPTPATGGADELPKEALDAYAEAIAATDPGPDSLDVEDEPDPVKERNPSPRPEDGPQDAPQEPDETPEPPAGEGGA